MKAKIILVIISAIMLIVTMFGFVTDDGVIGGGGITGPGQAARPTGIATPGYTGLAPAPTAAPYPEPINPYPAMIEE